MTYNQKGALLAFGVALLAACSSNNGSPPVTPGPARPLAIGYTAIGASDAVGFGATVPCTQASPALVADPTCPETGASGYVPDVVKGFATFGFAASLQDLGISGAVIGPDIQTTANMYGTLGGPTPCLPRTPADAVPANFLQNELPAVNPGALFVTIFAGGNDVNAIVNALACGAGGTTPATQTAFVTQEVTAFGHDFATLVGAVHKNAPSATIVVANIPNFANVPYAAQQPAAVRQALQGISVAIDTNVINMVVAAGVPVVDLQCDPRSYMPSNFYTDGFHPNDAGYAALASSFLTQALANAPAAPQAQCAQQGIQSAVRAAMQTGTALDLPKD